MTQIPSPQPHDRAHRPPADTVRLQKEIERLRDENARLANRVREEHPNVNAELIASIRKTTDFWRVRD
jgi:hypothetical protein